MHLWQKALYWGVAGALVGLGALGLGSFLQILFFPGIALLIYGMKQIGAGGIWAAGMGMGAVPAALLLYQYFMSNPCRVGGSTPCNFHHENLPVVALFGAVALAGVMWALIKRFIGPATGSR